MDNQPRADFAVPQRTFRFGEVLDGWLNRAGVTGQLARDTLLAGLVTIVSLLMMVAMVGYGAGLEDIPLSPTVIATITVAMIAQSVSLCLRRFRPVLCLMLVVVCQVPIIAVLPADITQRGPAALVAAYTIGLLMPTRKMVGLLGVAVGIEAAGGVVAVGARPILAPWLGIAPPELFDLSVIVVYAVANILLYMGAALIGTHVATRREHLALLKVRAIEEVEAQRAKVASAVNAERSRLARELHDIAAHHLSAMVVQAAAVERLIDKDSASAKEATAAIRSQGKETLKNLRFVVGVLRERQPEGGDAPSESGDDEAPAPGLAALDALVSTARQLGNPVHAEHKGQHRPLPAIADTTLYRVAQEALSNVRQYAPGSSVRLSLIFGRAHVALDIDNAASVTDGAAGSDSRQGLGLIGMKERVQLVGGTLSTGPTEAGGWRVVVTVPDTVPESGVNDMAMSGRTSQDQGPHPKATVYHD